MADLAILDTFFENRTLEELAPVERPSGQGNPDALTIAAVVRIISVLKNHGTFQEARQLVRNDLGLSISFRQVKLVAMRWRRALRELTPEVTE